LEAQDTAQQIIMQMGITTPATTWSSEDQLKMAQQLAATIELVAWLTMDKRDDCRDRVGSTPEGRRRGHS
jgi:hypothetical protein